MIHLFPICLLQWNACSRKQTVYFALHPTPAIQFRTCHVESIRTPLKWINECECNFKQCIKDFKHLYIFQSSPENISPLILEREEGGGKEREKHRWAVSPVHPNRASNLQPRHVPWPGIELVTFRCTEQCGQGLKNIFDCLFLFLELNQK